MSKRRTNGSRYMEACLQFRERVLQLGDGNTEIALYASLSDVVLSLMRTCTGSEEVVQLFIDTDVIQLATEVCRLFVTLRSVGDPSALPESEQDRKIKQTLVVRTCRLVSNFTACGETARAHLFNLDGGAKSSLDPLGHVLSAAVVSENRGAVAAAVGAVYNCLNLPTAESAGCAPAIQFRCQAFCANRSFLCQMLLAVMPSNKLSLDVNAGSSGSAGKSGDDPALEWFHMLAFLLVRQNLVYAVYAAVGPSTVRPLGEEDDALLAVTHEQLILLQLVSNVMEDTYCAEKLVPSNSGVAVSAPQAGECILSAAEDVPGRGRLLELLHRLAVDVSRIDMASILSEGEQGKSDQTDADPVEQALAGIEYRMRRGLMQDFLPLALQVLGSTLAIAPAREGHYLRAHLVTSTPLLHTVVQLLCLSFAQKTAARGGRKQSIPATQEGCDGVESRSSGSSDASLPVPPTPPAADVQESVAAAEVETTQSETQLERLRECVRLALQLLGNLVYGCDAAKDALRESGALAAVLSHCGTDFENPISREWALLCVRNACDSHMANQSFIQELRPQGAVIQDEKMKALGMKVEMNADTGKFKFVSSEK